ncbi:glycosyl hydrolase [Kitasatospora sp. NPDC057015]|uniref:glycosyl hydrolase n=1 Tax=Kitasatospora sp. NPDC057015 TaxID=3346001 RepID=UPI00362FB401
MSTFEDGGLTAARVAAAQQGDGAALDDLLAVSLPLVYNIVGRSLGRPGEVDDLSQEILLRIVAGLPQLRDPSAFRSWLVAVTVRQVRWHRAAQVDAVPSAALEEVPDQPDPQADFVDLSILRLGLTGQRREVALATRWLDPADQELLALWWLEAAGQLGRAELAAAVGLSTAHTAVRVQRMKQQLDIARSVVRALESRPGCPELAALAEPWDGVPGPLWRKRLARHVRDCAQCTAGARDLIPAEGLLAGLALVPVPTGHSLPPAPAPTGGGPATDPLAEPGALAEPGTSTSTSTGTSTGTSTSTVSGTGAGRRAARLGRRAVRGRAAAKSLGLVVGAVAAVAALGVLAATLNGGDPRPVAVSAPLTSAAAGDSPSAAAPEPTGPSASPSAEPSPAPSADPGASPSASARPTAAPSTKPAPTASAPPAAPAAQPVRGPKKGVSTWAFDGVGTALTGSGASWYYTWGPDHAGIAGPAGVDFVPMIWGAAAVGNGSLAKATQQGSGTLLGFNEPDLAAQSNLTPQQALDLWPKLMATGLTLGSPAVAYGGADPGGWLDQFMQGARSRGYRVDFIALHWYGSDFRTAEAVGQLQRYLQAVHDRYQLPVWLTEFALIKFAGGTSFPTSDQQVAFVRASTAMLQGLPYVQRYAWFALPATEPGATGLFQPGGAPNAIGSAYAAAGR